MFLYTGKKQFIGQEFGTGDILFVKATNPEKRIALVQALLYSKNSVGDYYSDDFFVSWEMLSHDWFSEVDSARLLPVPGPGHVIN